MQKAIETSWDTLQPKNAERIRDRERRGRRGSLGSDFDDLDDISSYTMTRVCLLFHFMLPQTIIFHREKLNFEKL